MQIRSSSCKVNQGPWARKNQKLLQFARRRNRLLCSRPHIQFRTILHRKPSRNSVNALDCMRVFSAFLDNWRGSRLRPAKWISNWFSRQRTKSRKNGEIIDMTCAIGDATPVIKVEENLDVSVADCSSSPSMLDIQVSSTTEKAGPVKASRKRPPRKSKAKKKSQTVVKVESQETPLPAAAASSVPMQRCPPQLLPLATVSCRAQTPLPVPPPTRSGMASRPQVNRIYSQNTTANAEAMPEAHAHENVLPTNHHRQNRPIMRNGFRHSVPSDYYSDPISADAASPYQKDLDCDSHRASSPIQCSASDFAPAHSMINHFTLASTAGSSIGRTTWVLCAPIWFQFALQPNRLL